MFNHQFVNEFSQNFIEQVNRVLNFDSYLVYSIDNINHAYDYQGFNISNKSLTEYLNYKVENDPVSFKKYFNEKDHCVELLSQHCCDEDYDDFMQRWKVQDTAEIFFRKRNGEPALGLSIVREGDSALFNEQEKTVLEAFCELSKRYFFTQTDSLEITDVYRSFQFTKKETLVLELILQGFSNQAISVHLNCSLATVKTHVQHIFQKTNLNNRQEIMIKFLK